MTKARAAETDRDEARRLLGERLRLRRDEVGLNQTDVGILAGISRTTIRAVEAGRSVEERTIASVKRALGCAPATYYRNRADSEAGLESPRPVLSVGATRILTQAVLRSPEESADVITADYLDLVNALSEVPPELPDTLSRFWDALHMLMPPADIQLVDREIQETIAVAYGQGPAGTTFAPIVDKQIPALISDTPRDPLPNALVGAVVQSGLSPQIQKVILDTLSRRQVELKAQMRAQLESEAGRLIAATYGAMRVAAEALGENIDSPRVEEIVSKVMPDSIRRLYQVAGIGPSSPTPPPNAGPR